jgi:hypothetical protein
LLSVRSSWRCWSDSISVFRCGGSSRPSPPFSILAFLFVRPILVRKLKLDFKPQVDTMIGETATPLEDIGPAQIGKAEMRGTSWTARNVGETSLTRGQRCVVAVWRESFSTSRRLNPYNQTKRRKQPWVVN